MHTFSIDKKMDYSCPILFVPGCSATQPVQKTTSVAQPKKSTGAIAPQKKTTIVTPTKTDIKKQESSFVKTCADTVKPVIIEPKKISVQEKIEVKKIETEKKPLAKTLQDTQKELKEDTSGNHKKDITRENQTVEVTKKQTASAATATPNKLIHEVKPYISNNYREVEALKRGAQLQKELVKQWHPPIGIAPNTTCDISFFVTQQGKIENLKTSKSSGIVMFDISARQALLAMKMPTWTYGKPLIISFK